MEPVNINARRIAIENATANSALSGFIPTSFAASVFEQWISGLDGNDAVLLLITHHKMLEAAHRTTSDGSADENLLGLTDSAGMRLAEADITTLRMAELMAK